MLMQIDETRRYDESVSVDRTCPSERLRGNASDVPIGNTYIRDLIAPGFRVEYPASANDNVIRRAPSDRRNCRENQDRPFLFERAHKFTHCNYPLRRIMLHTETPCQSAHVNPNGDSFDIYRTFCLLWGQ
jgi:hypothetical protein